MAYTFELQNETLVIVYRGSFSLEELELSRRDAGRSVDFGKVKKILLNFTTATPNTSFVEIFTFAGSHKEDIQPQIPTASVIPRQSFPDFYEYLETVSTSFQNLIFYCDTVSEARGWLDDR